MKQIRIKNDVVVIIDVAYNYEPIDFAGKQVNLWLKWGFQLIPITDFVITSNRITFTFSAKEQEHAGKYNVVLQVISPDGTNTLDKCDAFELVSSSCVLTEPSPVALGTYEVGLSMDLYVEVGGSSTVIPPPVEDYERLRNKPSINDVVLTGNKTLDELGIQPAGSYITTESDPTVPEWAKQPNKPTYTAADVSAIPVGGIKTINNVPVEGDGNITLQEIGAQPEGDYITDGDYSLATNDDYFVRGKNKDWLKLNQYIKTLPTRLLELKDNSTEQLMIDVFGSKEVLKALIKDIVDRKNIVYLGHNNTVSANGVFVSLYQEAAYTDDDNMYLCLTLLKDRGVNEYIRLYIAYNNGIYKCTQRQFEFVAKSQVATINGNNIIGVENIEVGVSYLPLSVINLTNQSMSEEIIYAWGGMDNLYSNIYKLRGTNPLLICDNSTDLYNNYPVLRTQYDDTGNNPIFSFIVILENFTFKKFEFTLTVSSMTMKCNVTEFNSANIESQLSDLRKEVKDLYDEIQKDRYNEQDYCVGEWVEEDLNPQAKQIYGNPDILSAWHAFLIDTTDNAGEKTTPVGKLKKNNFLRFEDGRFAPTVGITEAQRAQCDVELYLDSLATQKYCDAGAFDAATFYTQYGMEQKLYNAQGAEITHILRPWETTETKYTIGIGREDTVYLLDNVKGRSGKIWKGIFLKPAIWDGIDVSDYPLAPTAISPSEICTINSNSRSFFYLYEGETNCKSSSGQSGLCTMFLNGRTYSRVNDINQLNLMKYTRNNNINKESPVPFAEVGYHALNTYITCFEVLYATKYLHSPDLFGSGISVNETCDNEATWLANGGCRYKESLLGNYKYLHYNQTPDIAYNQTGDKTTFDKLLNNSYPKEQCMESQMAASFAVETGVPEDTPFNFYGATYRFLNVSGAKGLSEGDMNVIVYKVMSQTISAFNTSLVATDYDIEVNLKMSLYGGVSLVGNTTRYSGGGYEEVVDITNTAAGGVGNISKSYLEVDQSKWVYNTTFSKDINDTFIFEDKYKKIGEYITLGSYFSKRRKGYTVNSILNGGSISTGECFRSWDSNYIFHVSNKRAIAAVRLSPFSYTNKWNAPRSINRVHVGTVAGADTSGNMQCLINVPSPTV